MRYVSLLTALILVSFVQTNDLLADVPGVHSWAYQLQNADPVQISANTTFNLMVMDQSRTGNDSGAYTPAEIASIKNSGKIPVCYLSIGEAENYRSYWQAEWETNPPSWLGPENPDWPGNFEVRFWDPQWQAIIFDNIRTITEQGFEGLYLDIVDGYWYWSEAHPENPQADRDMANFVIAIGDSLRTHGGSNQLLIPQNGEYIVLEDDVEGPLAEQYFQAIDAIGIEDVFFFGELDENNPWNPDPDRLGALTEYRQRGITVLSVEYLTTPALIEQYRQAAADADFIPYTSIRALDFLTNGIPASSAPEAENNESDLMVSANSQNQSAGQWSFRIHSDSSGQYFQLEVFDLRGRRMINGSGFLNVGWNEVSFSTAKPAASGVYLYRIKGDEHQFHTGKIRLVF